MIKYIINLIASWLEKPVNAIFYRGYMFEYKYTDCKQNVVSVKADFKHV